MTFVSSLSPSALWRHFDALLAIPRPSRHEQAAGDYVLGVARAAGLCGSRDKTGNILIRRPATPGREGRGLIALQSHLDMVCEKNAGTVHDFLRDPIRPRLEGDWLYATGTTLGADNGIGVAAMCAVMEDAAVAAGPLELLFTVNEETGLHGAMALAPGALEAKRLINVDGEEDTTITIGGAGGAGVTLAMPVDFAAPGSGQAAIAVTVAGLGGGHSGADIHLQRGNAIKLLARALFGIGRSMPVTIASLQGGNLRNAIPREASAVVLVKNEDAGRFRAAWAAHGSDMAAEYKPVDPGLTFSAEDAAMPDRVLTDVSGSRLLQLLHALPHGVAAMSTRLPGLVESSSNLASVRIDDNRATIHVSNRSSDAAAIRALQDRVVAAGQLAGCTFEEMEGYPGWKPDPDSPLLKAATAVYRSLFGSEPLVRAIHAGLECGIIGGKHPGMDMISIGPTMEHPHSPQERVLVPSVERFYRLVVALLADLH